MDVIQRLVVFGLIAGVVFSSGPLKVHAQPQSTRQQNCVVAMNKYWAKAFTQQIKEVATCTKFCGKSNTLLCPDVTACWASDPRGNVQKLFGRIDNKFDQKCDPNDVDNDGASGGAIPDFGLAGGGVPAGTVAVLQNVSTAAGVALATDIFGPEQLLTVGSGPTDAIADCADPATKYACKCQQAVSRRVVKLAETILAEYTKCANYALKQGAGPFSDGAQSSEDLQGCADDLYVGCFPGGCGIASDAKGRIARDKAKLAHAASKSCFERGITVATQYFPNLCASVSTNGYPFADCLQVRVQCRVCQALNQAAGLAIDCDLFDDKSSNGSCADTL